MKMPNFFEPKLCIFMPPGQKVAGLLLASNSREKRGLFLEVNLGHIKRNFWEVSMKMSFLRAKTMHFWLTSAHLNNFLLRISYNLLRGKFKPHLEIFWRAFNENDPFL